MTKSPKKSGTITDCGNAVFTSVEAVAAHQDFARREHAPILAFRADLAAGMPLEDAEVFLREDLKALGEENEGYIRAILNNPDRDPPNVYACPADLKEAA
jgi:hypothetical protein